MHPTKQEIRFKNQKQIHGFIFSTLKNAIQNDKPFNNAHANSEFFENTIDTTTHTQASSNKNSETFSDKIFSTPLGKPKDLSLLIKQPSTSQSTLPLSRPNLSSKTPMVSVKSSMPSKAQITTTSSSVNTSNLSTSLPQTQPTNRTETSHQEEDTNTSETSPLKQSLHISEPSPENQISSPPLKQNQNSTLLSEEIQTSSFQHRKEDPQKATSSLDDTLLKPSGTSSPPAETSTSNDLNTLLPPNNEGDSIQENLSSLNQEREPILTQNKPEQDFSTENTSNYEFPLGYAIGQLKGIFVLAENKEGLVIVDMHAAHERIVYENLKTQFYEKEILSQRLLAPLSLSLSDSEMEMLEEEEIIDFLTKLGFEVSPFGANTLSIRAIPLPTKRCRLNHPMLSIN